jgi:hypothetical protein
MAFALTALDLTQTGNGLGDVHRLFDYNSMTAGYLPSCVQISSIRLMEPVCVVLR